jgi:hypothetical protein
MPGARHGRRAFLTAAAAAGAGVTSIGQASAAETDGLDNVCSRTDENQENGTFPIDIPSMDAPDSSETIDVNVADSGREGPTAVIVGGIHGDEEAGIITAHKIADWEPDAGQIVILPAANPIAIENDTRATERGDLNRKFVYEQPPTSRLAQTIWQTVTMADPDLLISLQESRGIYRGAPAGVGQAIFRSPGQNTGDAASLGRRMVNRTIGRQQLKFDIGGISGPRSAPSGLLAEKAAYEAGIPSFIVETYEEVNQRARIRWQKQAVIGILNYYNLYD